MVSTSLSAADKDYLTQRIEAAFRYGYMHAATKHESPPQKRQQQLLAGGGGGDSNVHFDN